MIIENVKISAISACVPTTYVDNFFFAKDNHIPIETIQTIGINKRHVVVNQTAMDLCIIAAKRIMTDGIGAIIFVTSTPSNRMPNNSSYCQHALDLPKSTLAFDINLACSGYPYGLYVASLVAKNLGKKVLLLDGHTTSQYAKTLDTRILFGDAGSATIVEQGNCTFEFEFETDGVNRDALFVENHLEMNGIKVFSFGVTKVPKVLNNLLGDREADYLILHQSNLHMIEKMAKKIKHKEMLISLNEYGNTSSTSIPLTMVSKLKGRKGLVAIEGFGAGLSTAAAIIEMKNYICEEVIVSDETFGH